MAAIKQSLLCLFFVVNTALGISLFGPTFPGIVSGQGESSSVTSNGGGETDESTSVTSGGGTSGPDASIPGSSATSALNLGMSGLPVGMKLPSFIPKPKPSEQAQTGTVKLNTDMTKLNDTLSEMQATLKDLEDFNITEAVDAITFPSFQKLRDHVTELQTSVNSIETSMTSLSADLANIQVSVGSTSGTSSGDLQNLQQQIDSLTTWKTSVTSQLYKVKTTADNAMQSASNTPTANDVDNLKAEVTNLQSITSNMPDAALIDDVHQQIADINIRLDATDAAVEDLNSKFSCSPSTCAEHEQASCSCVGDGRCINGSKHQCIEFECINYFNTPKLGLIFTETYADTFPFDLRAGMKIVAELSGNPTAYNEVDIIHNQVFVFHLSIRWMYNTLVFNDRNIWWGQDEVTSTLNPSSSPNRYRIDIDVLDTTFEVYIDGQHRLSGPIRHAIENFRTVQVRNIVNIYRFEVHTNGACA